MSDKFRVLDGEIDLEHDDVRDSQGHRIDADYGDRAVADAHARRGRRPLGDSTLSPATTPRVSFRVPEQTRRQAKERALAEGRSASGVARWSATSQPDPRQRTSRPTRAASLVDASTHKPSTLATVTPVASVATSKQTGTTRANLRPLDPQHVGVGICAGQSQYPHLARDQLTCGSSVRVQSVWPPTGPPIMTQVPA